MPETSQLRFKSTLVFLLYISFSTLIATQWLSARPFSHKSLHILPSSLISVHQISLSLNCIVRGCLIQKILFELLALVSFKKNHPMNFGLRLR